jgi:hypothetical protein
MRSLLLAAGLAVAMSTGAAAADLSDGPRWDRGDSAYDDPRYKDIYRHPDRSPYAAYRDDDDDNDDDDYRPHPRHAYADRGPAYGDRCVPREMIKRQLLGEGWHDFHDPDLRGDLASVRARRPSGRLFDLTIDRCTGEIVEARPLEARPYGPYAYGPSPRRWERRY